MKGSAGHMGTDVGLVATAFMMLVVGAWIAESGGFAIVVAIMLIGLIALFVPFAVIYHEQHELERTPRRHPRA
jgi:hypothetical protein